LSTNARQLRQKSTAAEKFLWEHLRRRQLLGAKFRRQHPIHPYIVDFYCPQHRLIIEVDGEIHQFQKDQDQFRQEWLTALGYTVIRFTNQQVFYQTNWVLAQISQYLDK